MYITLKDQSTLKQYTDLLTIVMLKTRYDGEIGCIEM